MTRTTPLSLRQKQIITAASAIVVLAFGALILWQTRLARDSAHMVTHTRRVLTTTDDLLQRMVDAETGERGYLLTDSERFLEPYRGARSDVESRIAELRALTADNAGHQSRIDALDSAVAACFASLDTLISLRHAGPLAPTTAIPLLDSGKARMDSVRGVIRGIEVAEERLLATRSAADARRARLIVIAIIAGTLVTIIGKLLLDRVLAHDASAQADAARLLEEQNARLSEQALEMEAQQERLQEQAAELEASNEELQATSEELESSNEHLAHLNRALRVIEARTTAVLNSTLDCIISMDAEGRITEWNAAAERTFGYRRDEAVGRALSAVLIPPDYREAHEAGLARYLATGESRILGRQVEMPAQRKDGTQFPAEVAITRVEGTEPPLFTGVLRDVSERRRVRRERERLITALTRTNQELDQFAYVASHDLKAPLRGIANLSSWIEEDLGDGLSGDTREKLDLMRGRVRRMEALIDGILQYSRAGRRAGKSERVDVGQLAAEVVELLAPPPDVLIELAQDMPVIVTDRVPLQQVFLNLMSNALKHVRRSDARVSVGWCDGDDEIEFAVADNGPGIAPRYHDRVFGIFQTLEARDKVEGTGIGLAVVKKIVEGKGGRVWVESLEGAGATFRFTWPKHEEESG